MKRQTGDWMYVDGWVGQVYVPDTRAKEGVNTQLRPMCGSSHTLAVVEEDAVGRRSVIGWIPVEEARVNSRYPGGCRDVKEWMDKTQYVIETQTPEVVERRRKERGQR